MANDLTWVAKHLAQNISLLRKKRNLSQLALAKLAGVPRSTVTYMESGQGNPSLQNLVRVAAALHVSIEELLNRQRTSCKLIKANDVPKQKRVQGMAQVYKLLPDPIPGMEMDRMEIEVGGRMGGIPHIPYTKEYLICLSGTVEVQVAGEQYEVKPGDVFAFPGDQPHSYRNIGKSKADCFSVVVLVPHGI